MKVLRLTTKLQLTLAALAFALTTGCASSTSVVVEADFPTVVYEPRDIRAAVVFEPAFREYIAQPTADVLIDIGGAQVDLLSNAFDGLFEQVEYPASREAVDPDTELVIVPSVQQVQMSTPSDSYLNVYEVWIKYSLDIETGDGVPVDSWFMPAYGKTPDSLLLSRSKAIREAALIALRDAGAKLLLDFYRIPAIYGWMQQEGRLEEADSS
ncbi:MAG: hypothetical protein AAGH19_05225 [Pseudomonadota bacterium]